jgi:hypothetical protein
MPSDGRLVAAPRQVHRITRQAPRGVRLHYHKIAPTVPTGRPGEEHVVTSFSLPEDFDSRQVDDEMLARLGIYQRAAQNPPHLRHWRSALTKHRYVAPTFPIGPRKAGPLQAEQGGGQHWAGLSLASPPSTFLGRSESFYAIRSNWTEPKIDLPTFVGPTPQSSSPPSFNAAIWIGFDGYGGNALPNTGPGSPGYNVLHALVQGGTEASFYIGGNNKWVEAHTAWWEWCPPKYNVVYVNAKAPAGPVLGASGKVLGGTPSWDPDGFVINAGDLVDHTIWLTSPPASPSTIWNPNPKNAKVLYSADFLYVNLTQSIFTGFNVTSPYPVYGQTAEWIVERPGGGPFSPIPRFGSVYFDDAWCQTQAVSSLVTPSTIVYPTFTPGSYAATFPQTDKNKVTIVQSDLLQDNLIRCKYAYQFG